MVRPGPLWLDTSHGKIPLYGGEDESLEQILLRHRVPLSLVTLTCRAEDGSGQPLPALATTKLGETYLANQVPRARVIRNISLSRLFVDETLSDELLEGTEWHTPSPDQESGYRRQVWTKAECQTIVQAEVDSVVSMLLSGSDRPHIIVGTSGGGDSNAMIAALANSRYREQIKISPVMILGIPDWDTQLPVAQEVCTQSGLNLEVISADKLAQIVSARSIDLVLTRFAEIFPATDREFIGTWLLRRGLTHVALSLSAGHIVFGANREDLLAESLSRLMAGLVPLKVPVRPMGALSFVYPLWRVPKKIADAVHWNESQGNYEARARASTDGRTMSLLLAHSLSMVPGADIALLEGFANLAANFRSETLEYDQEVNDHVVADMMVDSLRGEWLSFINSIS